MNLSPELEKEVERIGAGEFSPTSPIANWVRQGMRVALEAAQRECEKVSAAHWSTYKRGKSGEGRADPHYQGMADGAAECEDAIARLAGTDRSSAAPCT